MSTYDRYQFYPTPPSLCELAWSKFTNRKFVRCLEPSAGEGVLAAAAPHRHAEYSRDRVTVDVCEIDINKHPLLRNQGFNVVGVDFMLFDNGSSYSHIIMNAPFSCGCAHLLHAWEILWSGEIVAIINAETIKNLCHKERQLLASLIEQHGEVEYLDGAFMTEETERKTPVQIAIVHLTKKVDLNRDLFGDLIGSLRKDAETGAGLAGGYEKPQAVALPASVVENNVLAFKAAVQTMRESVMATNKAVYYARLLGETLAVRNGDYVEPSSELSAANIQNTIHEQYVEIKNRAWAGLLRSTNVTSRLSSAAQRRLESDFEVIKQLSFDEANIYGFLAGLIGNQSEIMQSMVCDVFDAISKHHVDNAQIFKGWKSNSKHRTCGLKIKHTRFIIPGHSTESYQSHLNWNSETLLNDFDKVFAYLDGRQSPEHGLVETFRQNFQELRRGARISSSYFDVRYYPGTAGTIHFFPLRTDLISRINRIVGSLRQWLPPADAHVSEAFWAQYENAEKYDAEIRKEVLKTAGNRWNNPLCRLSCSDTKEQAEASTAIDLAAETVLKRHGINTDFSLEAPVQAQLALAA